MPVCLMNSIPSRCSCRMVVVSLRKLDAAALVMPIAQINQWQTRLLEEDEGLIYQKGTQEVIFVEGRQIRFPAKDRRFLVRKRVAKLTSLPQPIEC